MTAIPQPPILVKFLSGPCGKRERLQFLQNLSSALSESYRPRIVLDLTGTTLADPRAIEVLLGCIAEITGRDGELSLVAPLPQTRLVLEITRIDRLVPVFASTEESTLGLGANELDLLEGMSSHVSEKGGTRWAA